MLLLCTISELFPDLSVGPARAVTNSQLKCPNCCLSHTIVRVKNSPLCCNWIIRCPVSIHIAHCTVSVLRGLHFTANTNCNPSHSESLSFAQFKHYFQQSQSFHAFMPSSLCCHRLCAFNYDWPSSFENGAARC